MQVTSDMFEELKQVMLKRFDVLDEKINYLDAKFKKLDNEVIGLKNAFNGYTKRSSDIFEITSNDTFARSLSQDNTFFKQLFLKELYSLDDNKPLTDFDGIFIVDYIANVHPLSVEQIEGKMSGLYVTNSLPPKMRYKQAAKFADKVNSLQQHPNPVIIIIESKNDIDKSKIDHKIQQLFQFEHFLDRIKSQPPNLQQASNEFRDMYLSPHFQEMLSIFRFDKSSQKSNIHLYFAADNWTRHLIAYVDQICNGQLASSSYELLTNNILITHDAKLLETVYKAAKPMKNLRTKDLANYATHFQPTMEYINSFNHIKSNASNSSNVNTKTQIVHFVNLIKTLQTFTIPYDQLQLERMHFRLGIISNGQVVQGVYGARSLASLNS